MAEFYEEVWVEGTALTPCEKGEGQEAVLRLMSSTVQAAVTALGQDRSVDEVVITTQTGDRLFPDVVPQLMDGLRAAGVDCPSDPVFERSHSNSQPAFGRAASRVESGEAERILFVGFEPLNAWPKEVRSDEIRRDILEGARAEFPSMLAALDTLMSHYAKVFNLSRAQVKAIIRKLSIHCQEQRVKNPWAQDCRPVDYDSGKNSPMEYSIRGEMVKSNLNLYDCCPTTSRGAVAVLTHGKALKDRSQSIRFVAHATETDPRSMEERFRFVDYPKREALYRVGEVLFDKVDILAQQGITRDRLLKKGIIEWHDATSHLIYLASMELGFLEPEYGGIENFERLDLSHLNPSGGLKANHPLAASYPTLLHGTRLQLVGQAGDIQVPDAEIGMVQSIGGARDKMSVGIFSRH